MSVFGDATSTVADASRGAFGVSSGCSWRRPGEVPVVAARRRKRMEQTAAGERHS